MYSRNEITPALVAILVSYNPQTGGLFWKKRDVRFFQSGGHSAEHSRDRWNTRYAGRPAFCTKMNTGYLAGHLFKHGFLAHRIAWAISNNEWPADEVDHINHDRADNRLNNLRAVTRKQNARNGQSHVDAASGFLGVSWMARDEVWVAQIGQTYIGRFATEEEAARAYDSCALKRFGQYANLNFPGEAA